MASLDDFFKKRDKKKKTTKSKLDIDEFAKKLEATTITGGDAEEGGARCGRGGPPSPPGDATLPRPRETRPLDA